MRAAEVVEPDVKAHGRKVAIQFLAKAVAQPREPLRPYAQGTPERPRSRDQFTRLGTIDAAPTPLRVVMNGNRLDIQASVDLAGLKQLKEMLTKFEGILEMMNPKKNEVAN